MNHALVLGWIVRILARHDRRGQVCPLILVKGMSPSAVTQPSAHCTTPSHHDLERRPAAGRQKPASSYLLKAL